MRQHIRLQLTMKVNIASIFHSTGIEFALTESNFNYSLIVLKIKAFYKYILPEKLISKQEKCLKMLQQVSRLIYNKRSWAVIQNVLAFFLGN